MELFDHKIVSGGIISCMKSEFGEDHINAIHSKGDLVLEFGQISLLKAWPIADDEGAFTFVNILKFSKSANALTPPRMKICGGKLRDSSKRVVCIARKLQNGGWENGFNRLFHKGGIPCGR